MDAMNLYFRQGHEHLCLHDAQLLTNQLQAAGYAGVVRTAFGCGVMADIVIDDPHYEWESLYLEAVKPAEQVAP